MCKNSVIMYFFMLLYIAHSQEIWDGGMDIDWYMDNENETEFTINSAEELAGLAMLASSGISFEGKTVVLEQSILLNDPANWKDWANNPPANINRWTPIGPNNTNLFNGTFDGNGHVISGIYINDPANDRQSLFGYLGSSGEIKNLGVTASYIKGDFHTGGLVGWNSGEISGCYSTAWVVGGMFFTGGLAGRNSGGTIRNSYSISTVEGESFVGGLVGQIADGAIINSYSVSEVTGTGSSIGGLVGGILVNSNSEIINSYHNLADMVFEDFEDWDFDSIWGIDGKINGGYPYLLWSAKEPGEIDNIRLPQIAGGQINIKATANAIVLSNLPRNAKIEAYNLQGKIVYSVGFARAGSATIPVQGKGVYVIKIGTQTFCVVVK